MHTKFKIILTILMSSALGFGFLHLFIDSVYNFERLHIFLFNLCSGGTILIYHTQQRKNVSNTASLFLVTSIIYAISAFMEIYFISIICAIILAIIVENVRIKKFSIFPVNFFQSYESVSNKFHQASLLCLSIGLIISSLVILNNKYLHIILLPKLKLDTFFLGFSFPLSLITMSVMFALIQNSAKDIILKNLSFWTINLGVIIFFIFILFEKLFSQLVISSVLFCSVIIIFYLFFKDTAKAQQKNFLISGMLFLIFTAITGIIYIALEFFNQYTPEKANLLLRMHTFSSLYGWNISGLAVICRYHDFPIKLHSIKIIIVHWITVCILAPLGIYHHLIALAAMLCYTILLYTILFSKKSGSLSMT